MTTRRNTPSAAALYIATETVAAHNLSLPLTVDFKALARENPHYLNSVARTLGTCATALAFMPAETITARDIHPSGIDTWRTRCAREGSAALGWGHPLM